jgi:hypothetical protein
MPSPDDFARFDRSIFRASGTDARLKLVRIQNGARSKLAGSQFGREVRGAVLAPFKSRKKHVTGRAFGELSASCVQTRFSFEERRFAERHEARNRESRKHICVQCFSTPIGLK